MHVFIHSLIHSFIHPTAFIEHPLGTSSMDSGASLMNLCSQGAGCLGLYTRITLKITISDQTRVEIGPTGLIGPAVEFIKVT